MKIIKYLIEAILIYICFIFIKLIGLNNGRHFFSYIFNIIGPLIKSKKTINSNLEKIKISYDDKKKKEITFNMWSNYGMTFVEYLYLNKFKNNKFSNSHINIKGQDFLDKIIKDDKPVIFVSGHFANFELMSMELTKQKINLATIYRPLNNFFLNPFMEHIRKKYVCKNQIKKGLKGIRDSVNYLNNNYSIALMIDQRVSEGEKLPFFNSKAWTTTLPAKIALKYKCDIVPVYIAREKNNNFEMEIYNPIKTNEKDDTEENKIKISLTLNKIIEEMILKDPSQWILTHNRWK
jgi:KDO2-lipid IV(A) lauroyltransferase